MLKINSFVIKKNKEVTVFTPGPASLAKENILGLGPCFGREDVKYLNIENFVKKKLKEMSGHSKIAILHGAASLAIEVMCRSFLFGKILIIKTGYYSDRIHKICLNSKNLEKNIKKIQFISWEKIDLVTENFDWVIACSVETSIGLKIPIEKLNNLSRRTKARLMLDATASFPLEKNHNLADVIAYSSCKGLCGFTGASFIAYNKNPFFYVKSFYLDFKNFLENKMTRPYHSIQSLFYILKNYDNFKYSIEVNKEKFLKDMRDVILFKKENQPLICTRTKKNIYTKNKNVILYRSRQKIIGSIICHLGEIHLGKLSQGKIINNLYY